MKKSMRLLFLSLILATILYGYPINSIVFRLTFIASIIFVLMCFCVAFWDRKHWIWIAGSILLLTIGSMFLPGKTYKSEVYGSYLDSLYDYEGVRYVWGGENGIGIDCSGLPRKALIQAYRWNGIINLDAVQLKKAFLLWWYDTSAKTLLNDVELTTEVTRGEAIKFLDVSKMQSGDFAITADGIHVLVYLGGNEWIEADPNVGKVIRVTTPSKNYWFTVPVVVKRWKM